MFNHWRSLWSQFARGTTKPAPKRRRLRFEGLEDRKVMALMLDPYFGIGGQVVTNIGVKTSGDGAGDVATSVAVMSNGQIAVSGPITGSPGSNSTIVKYNAD